MIQRQWSFVTLIAFIGAVLGIGLEVRADLTGTYIAVGDSLAFGVGFDDSTNDLSNGDRGYVKGLADLLQTRNGGVRPLVFDYGISGETSDSYFPLNIGTGVHGNTAAERNTNYANAVQTVSQEQLVLGRIASEHTLGHQVSLITVQLGSNDLNKLLIDQAFAALTDPQKQAAVGAALTNFAKNEAGLLQELKIAAPEAKLVTLGYYNPFAPFLNITPTDAATAQAKYAAQQSQAALPALNQTIGGVTGNFPGAIFVDIMPSFVGNEFTYTYIAQGQVHPTSQGYSVITKQLGVAVPEPSSFILIGLGIAGLVGISRRSRLNGIIA